MPQIPRQDVATPCRDNSLRVPSVLLPNTHSCYRHQDSATHIHDRSPAALGSSLYHVNYSAYRHHRPPASQGERNLAPEIHP